MKKIIAVVILIATIFTLCACNMNRTITPAEYDSTFDGVYIVIDSVSGDGKNEKLNVTWHNETEYDVMYGYGYSIEYFRDGEWVKTQFKDFAIIEIACWVSPGTTSDMSYKTEYFNLLIEGKYRLSVDFYVHNKADGSTGATSYAYFTVTK